MSTQTETEFDPIPEAVRQVVDLFEDALVDVQFPDVDKASLEEGMAAVRAQADAVDRIRGELEAARQGLQRAQESLRTQAQRGLAYAKVYAEGDESLTERLDGISFGGRKTKAKKGERQKTTTRRKKAAAREAAPETELPFEGEGPKPARTAAPQASVAGASVTRDEDVPIAAHG